MYDTKKKHSDGKNNFRNELFDWLDVLTVALVTVVLIFTFVCRVATIEGSSMEQTFHDSERVVVSNLKYTPKQGDVVIVSRNYSNSYKTDMNISDNQPIIKRVIATENQKIAIENGCVYVDGVELSEPYIGDAISEPIEFTGTIDNPVTVPKGCVFVMGDNREHSKDSRFSDIGNRGDGMVNIDNIIGKVRLRIFPFDKFGGFR